MSIFIVGYLGKDCETRRVPLARALTRQCEWPFHVHPTLATQSDRQWPPTWRRRQAGLPIVLGTDGPMCPSYDFGFAFLGFGASLISFTGTAFACGSPGVLRPLATNCSSS